MGSSRSIYPAGITIGIVDRFLAISLPVNCGLFKQEPCKSRHDHGLTMAMGMMTQRRAAGTIRELR
jgi:hypothetical protein